MIESFFMRGELSERLKPLEKRGNNYEKSHGGKFYWARRDQEDSKHLSLSRKSRIDIAEGLRVFLDDDTSPTYDSYKNLIKTTLENTDDVYKIRPRR